MGIVSLTKYQWLVPEVNVGDNGQLSDRSYQAQCVGNFERHSLTYLRLDCHYAKYRYLPMLGWNKQTRFMDMKIENTLGLSFAEWNKQLVKLAVKQAWQVASHEAKPRGAHNEVRDLRDSELERLASKLLPAMKRGFGVHKVTQQVSAPLPSSFMGLLGLTPAAKKSVEIEIDSKNGHVFDLSRLEVARQVRHQLKKHNCSYSRTAVTKVVNALYFDSKSSAVPVDRDKNFGFSGVYAKKYIGPDVTKNISETSVKWAGIVKHIKREDIDFYEKLQNITEADEVLNYDSEIALDYFLDAEVDDFPYAEEVADRLQKYSIDPQEEFDKLFEDNELLDEAQLEFDAIHAAKKEDIAEEEPDKPKKVGRISNFSRTPEDGDLGDNGNSIIHNIPSSKRASLALKYTN